VSASSGSIYLFSEAEAAEKETHPENEEKVCQYRAQERSLHNSNLFCDQRDYEDDELHCVAESDIQ